MNGEMKNCRLELECFVYAGDEIVSDGKKWKFSFKLHCIHILCELDESSGFELTIEEIFQLGIPNI